MSRLHWHTYGSGDRDLVLLHGWGLNAGVWHSIQARLGTHFRLHMVDLPGYGQSQGYGALGLAEMTAIVAEQAPDHAWWLGWSLGGLVASQAALIQPERVAGLITVASSPCFTAAQDWPGIRPEVLAGFQQQLSHDFQRTVGRFLALQTLGTASAREDARLLKSVVLNQPLPDAAVLNAGLEILRTADLRQAMIALEPPLLRIYGYLDGLVPRRVAAELDRLWPCSTSAIIPKAAHAPFVSHPAEFTALLLDFMAVR